MHMQPYYSLLHLHLMIDSKQQSEDIMLRYKRLIIIRLIMVKISITNLMKYCILPVMLALLELRTCFYDRSYLIFLVKHHGCLPKNVYALVSQTMQFGIT
jgi:hypothetical protein